MDVDSDIVPGSTRRIAAVADCQPALQELHAVWERLRGTRRMPARRDFDPVEVPKLLPRMFLVDVIADGPPERRFRSRLQGTEVVAQQGIDWTGHFLHEIVDRPSADRLCAVAEQIVASRAPFMSAGRLYWIPDKPFYQFETILLPLSEDDNVVNMIMGMVMAF